MKVYFVRHGESVGNREEFHQTVDTPLSAAGVDQAKKIAGRLKKFNVDLIITSPVARARETAGIISKTINIPIEEWDELIEVNHLPNSGESRMATRKLKK
jgi:uncharacterized phosphatase